MNRQNIEDIYPLSPMQKGMLFHTLYAPESGVYFNQTVYTLRGDLNATAFAQAWQRVMERHAVLRTLFLWERRDEPLQVVRQQVKLPWVQQDWRGLSLSEQQERLEAYLAADRHQGCALSRAPLMRLALLRLAEDAYYFLWSRHHLLLDRWSSTLVLREVFALYQAFHRGEDLHLEPVRPYRDYIAWLRRQDLARAEAFWRQALKGFTGPTALGVDRTPGSLPGQKVVYDEQQLQLPAATTAALQSLARQQRLTLNTLVQGAWALLLSRYSGEADVVFGTTVSGRPPDLAGVESMVGPFINTLPLRVQISPQERLLPWLQRLQEQVVELRQYEYSPLVQIQGWSEIPRSLPLFESILVFENAAVGGSVREWGGDLEVSRLRSEGNRTGYPLTTVALPGRQLLLRIIYDCCRFAPLTITRLLGHFQTLLEGIAAGPERALVTLPLLTAAEWQQLPVGWTRAEAAYPGDECLHQRFAAQVERTPNAVAVVYEGQELTYRELNRRANQLAHSLQRLGVGPDVLVGVFMERSVEMVVALLGILKAGGAYVPLDPAYPHERLVFILEETQAPILVTHGVTRHRLSASGVTVVCLDADREALAQEGTENLHSAATAKSLAYVIYTSGSTGRPKGVAVPHRGVQRLVSNTNYIHLEPTDIVGQASNCAFDAATFEIWGALLHGARLVGIPTEVLLSPHDLAATIEQQDISVLFVTTALFNQTAHILPIAFKRLQYLLFGGEAADPRSIVKVLRHGPPARLVNVYGPTETTTFATWYPVQEVTDGITSIPIGRPITNTQTYVLDAHLRPVPIGVPGELYIGGDGVARGYLKCPELTAERFVPDPFSTRPGARLYKSGDLVRYRQDGNLEFLGRQDQQMKLRGYRIELGEIEAVLSQHPGVHTAVVMAREDVPGDKRLVAYVLPSQEQIPVGSVLRHFLQEKLPEYMVPSAVVVLETFPLTPNGKVDRRALPAPDMTRAGLPGASVAPRDRLELQLVQMWEEILDVHPVGVTENFFDLGGHSLLAVRVMARMHQQFGQKLALSTFFQGATIEQLAAVLRRVLPSLPLSPLVGMHLSGAQQPFFCVHPAGGSVLCYVDLARHLGADRPFYGLQHPGIDGEAMPDMCIEDMAQHYIQALRACQPVGPYLLGGWSMGGMVAFEMAQQLVAQGQKIALLILLDTHAMPAKTLPTDVSHAALLCRFAQDLGLFLDPMRLATRPPEAQVAEVLAQARAAQVVPAEVDLRELHRRIQVYLNNARAARRYTPNAYAGHITLLKASDRAVGHDPTLGWGEIATGGVMIHTVPGNHYTMLQQPHVQILAQQLSQCLAAG